MLNSLKGRRSARRRSKQTKADKEEANSAKSFHSLPNTVNISDHRTRRTKTIFLLFVQSLKSQMAVNKNDKFSEPEICSNKPAMNERRKNKEQANHINCPPLHFVLVLRMNNHRFVVVVVISHGCLEEKRRREVQKEKNQQRTRDRIKYNSIILIYSVGLCACPMSMSMLLCYPNISAMTNHNEYSRELYHGT